MESNALEKHQKEASDFIGKIGYPKSTSKSSAR